MKRLDKFVGTIETHLRRMKLLHLPLHSGKVNSQQIYLGEFLIFPFFIV
jgi:hypothetical protein